jgi:hypothetical protein
LGGLVTLGFGIFRFCKYKNSEKTLGEPREDLPMKTLSWFNIIETILLSFSIVFIKFVSRSNILSSYLQNLSLTDSIDNSKFYFYTLEYSVANILFQFILLIISIILLKKYFNTQLYKENAILLNRFAIILLSLLILIKMF